MTWVGVRELRNDLSRYLKRVQSGETIVVSQRGRPVARIIPIGIPEDVARFAAEGRITWSSASFDATRTGVGSGRACLWPTTSPRTGAEGTSFQRAGDGLST